MTLPVSNEKRVYDNVLGAMGHMPLVRLKRSDRRKRYGFTAVLAKR